MARLLLDRTDGLPTYALAAFIDGWGSLLQVLDRADLVFPEPTSGSDSPTDAARHVLEEAVRRVRAAQALVLDDDSVDLDGA